MFTITATLLPSARTASSVRRRKRHDPQPEPVAEPAGDGEDADEEWSETAELLRRLAR